MVYENDVEKFEDTVNKRLDRFNLISLFDVKYSVDTNGNKSAMIIYKE